MGYECHAAIGLIRIIRLLIPLGQVSEMGCSRHIAWLVEKYPKILAKMIGIKITKDMQFLIYTRSRVSIISLGPARELDGIIREV